MTYFYNHSGILFNLTHTDQDYDGVGLTYKLGSGFYLKGTAHLEFSRSGRTSVKITTLHEINVNNKMFKINCDITLNQTSVRGYSPTNGKTDRSDMNKLCKALNEFTRDSTGFTTNIHAPHLKSNNRLIDMINTHDADDTKSKSLPVAELKGTMEKIIEEIHTSAEEKIYAVIEQLIEAKKSKG